MRDGSGEHGPSATWVTSDVSGCKLTLFKPSAHVRSCICRFTGGEITKRKMDSRNVLEKFYKDDMFLKNKTSWPSAKSGDPTPTHGGWGPPQSKGASFRGRGV